MRRWGRAPGAGLDGAGDNQVEGDAQVIIHLQGKHKVSCLVVVFNPKKIHLSDSDSSEKKIKTEAEVDAIA